MTLMVLSPSQDAVAQFKWGDCLKVTKLSNPPDDSVTVISVEDTCRRRIDTIFVNDGKLVNGSIVLRAPSDSSIVFRYGKGKVAWVMNVTTTPPDTVRFGNFTFVRPGRVDTSYTRVEAPDTLQFLTNITGGAGDGNDSLFTLLRDTPNSYSGHAGKLVAVKLSEDGLEFVYQNMIIPKPQIIGYGNYPDPVVDSTAANVYLWGLNGIVLGHEFSITGDTIMYYWTIDWAMIKDSVLTWTGGGSSTFTGLTDTPNSYTGNAGKVVKVNPGEDALIFADDQTGSGGGGITSVMDTTNRVVSDTAYYWFFREMTPQGSMHPSAGGDSLLTKNRVGWKEWEVTWYQMRNNVTAGHLDFNIRSDSANSVAILMWEANGTSVRTSTTLPPYVSDATANWTVIWRPNLMGTQSGTTRSGGSPAGPTATTLIAAPNSGVRADGYAPIYWTNALMQQPTSGTTAHFFRLRVYYVTPVGTSSTWYVQLENL